MVAAPSSTQLFRVTLSIRTLRRTANASLPSKVIHIELLTLMMYFKGRSKPFYIDPKEVMVFAIYMNHRNFMAVEFF
jgi:hypothetical protein